MEFGATVQQKENGFRAHSSGFLGAYTAVSSSPLKLPGLDLQNVEIVRRQTCESYTSDSFAKNPRSEIKAQSPGQLGSFVKAEIGSGSKALDYDTFDTQLLT